LFRRTSRRNLAAMDAEDAENFHSGRFLRLRPEEALAQRGLRQHRQVTVAQLAEVGWDSSVVAKRVEQGRLHRSFTRVYSLGGPARTDRERWMAAVLSFGAGTLLAASPAAELYGWLRYPTNQIYVLTQQKQRPREGITPLHRRSWPSWRYLDDIPVTSPEQTILDCASTTESDRAYRRIVRQAQVDDLTSHARLLVFAARNAGARGVARLRNELADGPSRTRSGFEDDVLELFRRGGEPVPNYKLGGDEWDLAFPALRTLLEVQGDPHDNPTARADDIAKQERAEAVGWTVYWIS
jgi:hypothetical protein